VGMIFMGIPPYLAHLGGWLEYNAVSSLLMGDL
jgi:hypothetical protein